MKSKRQKMYSTIEELAKIRDVDEFARKFSWESKFRDFNVETEGRYQNLLIHYLVEQRNVKCLARALEMKLDVNVMRAKDGCTALHIAAFHLSSIQTRPEYLDIIKTLRQYNAREDILSKYKDKACVYELDLSALLFS